jgi:hypothetical protein
MRSVKILDIIQSEAVMTYGPVYLCIHVFEVSKFGLLYIINRLDLNRLSSVSLPMGWSRKDFLISPHKNQHWLLQRCIGLKTWITPRNDFSYFVSDRWMTKIRRTVRSIIAKSLTDRSSFPKIQQFVATSSRNNVSHLTWTLLFEFISYTTTHWKNLLYIGHCTSLVQ